MNRGILKQLFTQYKFAQRQLQEARAKLRIGCHQYASGELNIVSDLKYRIQQLEIAESELNQAANAMSEAINKVTE